MNPHQPKQDLREIGHLFLSSVRDRATGKSPRPQRVAPRQRADIAIDLTAEEMALVAATEATARATHAESAAIHVRCVLAAHLGISVRERILRYAARFCRDGQSVGLIETDAGEIRISVLDQNHDEQPGDAPVGATFDAAGIAQALDELAGDVNRWIIAIANPRSPEARPIIAAAQKLTVLATSDADGTVAAYRAIKGVYDSLHKDALPLPSLSLAVVDSTPAAAAIVTTKLAAVTAQFLSWPLEAEAHFEAKKEFAEHSIFHGRLAADTNNPAPHWNVLADFAARGVAIQEKAEERATEANDDEGFPVAEEIFTAEEPAPLALVPTQSSDDEVIDLPTGSGDARSVLQAVLAGNAARWIACPIAPPENAEQSRQLNDEVAAVQLAVARDRSLCILAVAGRGLSVLTCIAQAYEWARANRSLIAMALPQFAIDAHALPTLTLLVDHADAAADELRPIIAAGHVSIMTYRKLRWSGRHGLLLAAA